MNVVFQGILAPSLLRPSVTDPHVSGTNPMECLLRGNNGILKWISTFAALKAQ